MNSELARLHTEARERAIHRYSRSYDWHIGEKFMAMHEGDMTSAYLHEEAARIALRAYRADAFNPLPDGLP